MTDTSARPMLIDAYCRVRSLTHELTAPLSPEDQTAQSMPDVSPTKWHRAHVTWFFETFVLERFDPRHVPFDPSFRILFNSYYHGVGTQYPRAERGTMTRPSVTGVTEYRAAVDHLMRDLLNDESRTGASTNIDTNTGDIAGLVELGLQHEQQHQELLLMDIKHVLSRNPLDPSYRPQRPPSTAGTRSLGWIESDGGLVEVGRAATGFGFDNEFPRHRVHLEPFVLADRLVTAGEWRDFIDDGGYARPDLWLSDGWNTACSLGWQAPLYWHRSDDDWHVHTLGGRRPVTEAEPVCHVSFYEADAFARWSGARIPTEFEWEHATTTHDITSHRYDLDHLHPARAASPSTGSGTIDQVAGTCWQWTSSAYLPYPGFEPAPGAVGEYNGKFMSGQMVLRGGAAITPPGHARPEYRNFYPPSARWPMTGLRLARGGTPRCPPPP